MSAYDRIGISEGIDTNKTGCSCECIICHYTYVIGINFRFQPKVWDGCHDMTQKFMSFSEITIVTVSSMKWSHLGQTL